MAPVPRRRATLLAAAVLAAAVAIAACGEAAPPDGRSPAVAPRETASRTPASPAPATSPAASRTPDPSSSPRPAWLGTRVLPRRADGYGEMRPTPPELADRRLHSPDLLAPPAGDAFHATVAAVPDDVLARSTWAPGCPVTRDDLRYVTVGFWGFDGLTHTGELLVHHTAAEPLTRVFRALFDARFPLEELRVTTVAERDAEPTGDGNVTGAFNCRPSRGTRRWSAHARGLAVDLNPFHNPYVKGEVVLPELAGAYRDRSRVLPGMILPGDVVTRAFADIGWHWGGDWRSLKDWMHFSADGT